MRNFTLSEIVSIGVAMFALISSLYDIYNVNKNNKNKDNEPMKYDYIDIIASLTISLIALSCVFVFSPVHVSGESMEPTYKDGQWLLENKLSKNYEVGDVIVFYAPEKDKKLIKRIVAKGGDTVEVKNLKLYVNGEEVSEDYSTIPFEVDFPATTVPEGEFFVIGDNRPISLDSRYDSIGFVNPKYIEGEIIEFKKRDHVSFLIIWK